MIIITILLLISSLFYYRSTVIICAATLLFMPHITSGFGNIKLLYLISIVHVVLFYIKGYSKQSCIRYPRLLLIPSIITTVGYLLSNYWGVMGNYSISLVNCTCYFFYPFILWHIIDSRKQLLLYLKVLFLFFVIVCIYAVAELIVGTNFISKVAIEHNILVNEEFEEMGERFGFLRCFSILPYPSALGMTSAVVFMLYLYLKTIKFPFNKTYNIILSTLIPLCVLLSGTRSQFVVFAICIFPYLFWCKFLSTRLAKIYLVSSLLLLLFSYDYFFVVIDSIFNSNKSQMGSSSDMRIEQFEICLTYFLESPIWGFGKNYIWEYVRPANPALLGAESVWFQLMVDYGLIGCINYLIICVSSCILLLKHSKVLCFFSIAFITGKTLSIVIGLELSFLLVMTVIMVKCTEFIDIK